MTCAQAFRDPDPVDQARQPVGGEGVALAPATDADRVEFRRRQDLRMNRARAFRAIALLDGGGRPGPAAGAWAGEGLA